jgi:hypothetical protein
LSKKETVRKNLKFILSHFEGQEHKFPRSITAMKIGNQAHVNSEEEILQYFCESDFNDCSVSIYPFYDGKLQVSFPSIIHIYLDLSLCTLCKYPKNKLDYLLKQTLIKMEKEIKGMPTVLWNGEGYHICLPIDFDNAKNKVKGGDPNCMSFSNTSTHHFCNDLAAEELVRFLAGYFANTNKNAKHTLDPISSFIAIPETNNSKCSIKVETIQQWNGEKANVSPVLPFFSDYLIQQKWGS